MLIHPLPTLDAWCNALRVLPVPVLARTADEIAQLSAVEDARGNVDAHLLAEAVQRDPLMTLALFIELAEQRRARRHTQDTRGGPETITAALVMLGVGPFFRRFAAPPTVEAHLAAQPNALEGLRRVIHRAHRAGNFALGFAVHRMDDDAAIVQLAALLHDFAEMLLWCHAPTLALEIAQRQDADPTLRSAVVQQAVLHVSLSELEQALMEAWSLPESLARITDDRHAEHPQVQSVSLAIRLARHTQVDWDNAAVPDDLTDIARLLNLSVASTHKLVLDIDS
jgi:HD-like signal output (HDOD) protein